jgi:hypothetical protein
METPDQVLLRIRYQCERLGPEIEDALQYQLTTEIDDVDSAEAREKLTAAAQAAKALLAHLDKRFDFVNGEAVQKEETCPD